MYKIIGLASLALLCQACVSVSPSEDKTAEPSSAQQTTEITEDQWQFKAIRISEESDADVHALVKEAAVLSTQSHVRLGNYYPKHWPSP